MNSSDIPHRPTARYLVQRLAQGGPTLSWNDFQKQYRNELRQVERDASLTSTKPELSHAWSLYKAIRNVNAA